ncbi:type II toxin-antitoxin system RelE/ParE family toxin [Erwinia sp. Leaf53]|uniref:type II toxin-antitoxin system RelE/ParE family toxin n=1 Tax=Erwinia sp. Leaf53 TaxID=1736225 RepID=UPI0006F34B3C|nr:type II toxin-antitoxin system RelE/ParE family toxin [Erwinia sp. Leaf53]KQN57822.1 hypothetical protein ASF13_03225 [Erwinia sp. Leaf53]
MTQGKENKKTAKRYPVMLLAAARKELFDLNPANRAEFIAAIETFEKHGPASGIPDVEKIQGDMYELKTQSSSHWMRGFYFHYHESKYIITHIFAKKSNATPQANKHKGLKRWQDFIAVRQIQNRQCDRSRNQ